VFVHLVAVALAAAIGLGLAIWTSYATAPRWLVKLDSFVTQSVIRRTTSPLNDSIVSVAVNELKVNRLPAGYRYQALPYPIPARWDDPDWGNCQVHQLARSIPNPKVSTVIPTDTTVDGMYGFFLANIQPPGDAATAKLLFDSYMGARKTLEDLEKQYRADLGPAAARQWRDLRKEAAERHLKLSKQLQHALNSLAGVYAQAVAAYINEGYQTDVKCGTAPVLRQYGYSVRESLKEFRESAAQAVSVSGLAELIELHQPLPGQAAAPASSALASGIPLGAADVDMSFRRARVFHLDPYPWFNKQALVTLSNQLRPGSPQFWGDEGLFPLMPVAVLAVTEPVLKVKLTNEQALQLQKILANKGSLQVGTFQFDFGNGSYSVTSPNGAMKTELEFVAPRGEVVILGIFSKRPDTP